METFKVTENDLLEIDSVLYKIHKFENISELKDGTKIHKIEYVLLRTF